MSEAGGAAPGTAGQPADVNVPRPEPSGPSRWAPARSVTGEQIDMLALGGPEAHGRKSGVAHVVAASESDALSQARRISGYFARPGVFTAQAAGAGQDLRALLPDRPRRAYNVRPAVRAILDPADAGGGKTGGGRREACTRACT